MPDYEIERARGGVIAGVDEAGRGPLAGPVVAAAVILDLTILPAEFMARIDDSKALSAARRSDVAGTLMRYARARIGVIAGIAAASTAEIAALNILNATMLAMRRAVTRLSVTPDYVLIDGNRVPDGLPCAGFAVIGGDARSLSIAAASILAKVTRDRIMSRLDPRYPAYGWARNAGYGTADHRNALRRFGSSAHHRQQFCQKILANTDY